MSQDMNSSKPVSTFQETVSQVERIITSEGPNFIHQVIPVYSLTERKRPLLLFGFTGIPARHSSSSRWGKNASTLA